MSGRMREEPSLTIPLLRRPPRTPAAFNGQIRDKRERKQEIHPSVNEIFAVYYRGQKQATKTCVLPGSPSITKITPPPPSDQRWILMLKSTLITHFSNFISEKRKTLGFEVKRDDPSENFPKPFSFMC